MSEEMVRVLGDIAVALSPIVVAAIGALAAYLAKMINGKVKNDLLRAGIGKVNSMVWVVVKEISQTMAEDFKKASADGKLTLEEKRHLKNVAMKKLRKYLSFDELSRLFGMSSANLDDFIGSKVEEAVGEVKRDAEIWGKE